MFEDIEDSVAPPPHLIEPNWKITVTSEGAELETERTAQKLVAADDWDGVLRHFALNPDEFQIVDDTVRMSSWEQSKRLENGDRDTITLYSYRARFSRITSRLSERDVEDLRSKIHSWKPLKPAVLKASDEAPCAFYLGLSDLQVGKGDLAEISKRVLDSVERTSHRIDELRKSGRNITSLVVSNMGDPLESCGGHYPSQTFTVSATLRQQMNCVLDLWSSSLRVLAPKFEDVLFVSVLSNHGEFNRNLATNKSFTSDSDSADGFLAETLQKVLASRDGLEHVRYLIPHDEMSVLAPVAGIPVAFTHGHKAPGTAKEKEFLQAQSLRLLREHGTEPRLWMTAHRHHLSCIDYGSFFRIQHPTLEVSPSKWFIDTAGLWSTPGVLTMLIGEHQQAGGKLLNNVGEIGGRGFSDLAVL